MAMFNKYCFLNKYKYYFASKNVGKYDRNSLAMHEK